jgi:DNA repair ATPase RecN
MSSKEKLRQMEMSLNPIHLAEPKQKPRQPKSSAADLTEALLKLPEITSKLDLLLREIKTSTDALITIKSLDFSIRQLIAKLDGNVDLLHDLRVNVDKRVKALDAAEAKYKRLIENIDAVLPELEKLLSRS